MTTVDRINICISKAGISGAELCRSVGLSSGVYSQWCSGITKPSKKNVAKIAEYFGVSVEYLLYGNEKTAAQEGDGERQEWIKAWEQAGPEQRSAALAVLRLGVQRPEDQGKRKP